jgi:exo-beta-1,3-glucanase (GH17 family)
MDVARVALPERDRATPRREGHSRPENTGAIQPINVRGKFLFHGQDKYWVKGVTYGTFKPNANGEPFPAPERVRADFTAMVLTGINSIRTYTVPPAWLLDLALEYGLRVMAGLAWEQHIAFLDSRARRREIERSVLEQVRAANRHPAIMAFAVGNEIPAPIVRWHGRHRIEKFIKRLYRIVKKEDPSSLVTYVNYPTTEYLSLGFLDICCFNVFLEQKERLDAYLARLQNIAGDRPLLLTEVGYDSSKEGEEEQASKLDWQIRTAFSRGACGSYVFAWTDEWFRGGNEIEDWAFGLCRRDRTMKPSQRSVRLAYEAVPFPLDTPWPRVSVVVCSANGANTIRDTLDRLSLVDYPDYEVIVVDDGSTDETAAIASEYDVNCINIANGGLGAARNVGWRAASGEIVAYIDDDAYPDTHWLQFLAHAFLSSDFVAVGGLSPGPSIFC